MYDTKEIGIPSNQRNSESFTILGRENGTRQYQSIIRLLQWVVLLGRLDIATVVITMLKFTVNLWEGHLNKLYWIYGYLSRIWYETIKFRTGSSDLSSLSYIHYKLSKIIYGKIKKEIPADALLVSGKNSINYILQIWIL